MGQSPSSVRSRSSRRSFRGFARRSKLNKSNLSHTFSLPPSEEYPELMNINSATEEQLMTLPGVGRPLARAIVQHRQLIGRFKRVDDLALVSGIGAEKLELLRPEICTNVKKPLSRASSCTQSLDSVRLPADSRLCSVNSASVFQLQCVPGLNQELAANIVDYRVKKGPFKSLDDLIKVRGIDIVRLSTVKQHLSLESRKCESVQQLSNGHVNGWTSFNGSLNNNHISTPKSVHKKSLSMPSRLPVTLPNGFATAPVNDILDLLSAYSHRPIVKDDFHYERDGVRCCRLASWNLSQLTVDKINNPGVREVICRTILENKLSIVVLQDVVEETALRVLCEELNSPYLRRVREWRCNSQSWEYCMSSEDNSSTLGFLFESSNKAGISVQDQALGVLADHGGGEGGEGGAGLMEALAGVRECEGVAVQAFTINHAPLLIINVHCPTLAGDVTARLRSFSTLAPGVQVAVMGDVGCAENASALQKDFHSVLPDDMQTNLDPNNAGHASILCVKEAEKSNFNGKSGVIKTGLSHLAIPRGWSWGGPASPFCPVWAEYKVPD
ncbi:unnamed protein product [Plutella xylostella]|uniref:(diamondback moth) hypothetical protein n=1 Tax=Plutella xylostella TaxID=51655 RepID=A0A8S4EZY4_PLUXY|nr:unnamed protein product [Plutella xylostella]